MAQPGTVNRKIDNLFIVTQIAEIFITLIFLLRKRSLKSFLPLHERRVRSLTKNLSPTKKMLIQ